MCYCQTSNQQQPLQVPGFGQIKYVVGLNMFVKSQPSPNLGQLCPRCGMIGYETVILNV